jgi:hypothetical protein
MELHDLVRHEWNDEHRLSRRSLIWIHDHAEPGDPMPIVTAIAQLRAEAALIDVYQRLALGDG